MFLPDRAYTAALSSIYGFGHKTVNSLVECFGSAQAAWTAPEKDLSSRGISAGVCERLLAYRKNFDVTEYYQQLLEQNISLVTIFDAEYPEDLKRIYNPPAVLYIKGNLPRDCPAGIAIVGTRRATVYGAKVAHKVAGDLAANGICIVSGMARGIDTCAHKGALEAGGLTIAVLGCGVDVVYPPENRALAEQIQQSGAIVSEFPLGTPPDKMNFPARNRIISGLSRGVVVVEAPVKSGALITADFALEQGREVFAVPGPITSRNSEGCHHLIRDGARLLQGVEDVLEELWDISIEEKGTDITAGRTKAFTLIPKAEEILALLSGGPVFLDELCIYAGMSPGELNIVITKMELEGLVTKSGGKIYSIEQNKGMR